jgi:ABC-type antimicrobial peptide transport system permease subunit
MVSWHDPAFMPGYEYRPGESKNLNYNMVGRDYFKTLGIPFVRGRDFSGFQAAEIVVNETMARYYWPGQEALGREIRFEFPAVPSLRVVGIVKDSALGGAGSDGKPYAYVPMPDNYKGEWTMLIRTIGSAKSMAPLIRRIVSELDPGLPIANMRTLSEQLDISLMQVRGGAILLALLGVLALGLASMGLYGVVSYAVGRRTREIGIRIAIGGQRIAVFRHLISEGARLMAVGLLIGFVWVQAIAHIAQSALNSIDASDPMVYLGACLLLAIVALGACCVPIRKALKADPMSALRCE